jgi:uncharacterized protein (UPF0333 family)
MNRFRKFMEGLGNLLLILMFIVIMVVNAYVLIAAFSNLQLTNYNIERTIMKIYNHLPKYSMKKKCELKTSHKANIERLQAQAKGTLDSSTISFLFQVFTLALISAGVYILKRSSSNVRAAEKKTELVGPFAANATFSYSIASHCLNALQITKLLKTSPNEFKKGCIPVLRDSLKELKKVIQKADDKKIGIEKSQHELLLDNARDIIGNIKSLPQAIQENLSKSIEICAECLDILKSSSFVERYEEQLKILLDKS